MQITMLKSVIVLLPLLRIFAIRRTYASGMRSLLHAIYIVAEPTTLQDVAIRDDCGTVILWIDQFSCCSQFLADTQHIADTSNADLVFDFIIISTGTADEYFASPI